MPTGLKGSQLSRVRANAQSIINAFSASIVIRRNGVDLAAQSVMIQEVAPASETRGANATVANAAVKIYGPVTLDIRRGDRFYLPSSDMLYTVTQATANPMVQMVAYAEASQGA
jgi:hypothetical protein